MLDLQTISQDPHTAAYLILLFTHAGAAVLFWRWHRWLWVCYLLAALGYGLILMGAEPGQARPVPALDPVIRLCVGAARGGAAPMDVRPVIRVTEYGGPPRGAGPVPPPEKI